MNHRIAFISLSGLNAQHSCVYGLIRCLLWDNVNIDFFTVLDKPESFGIEDDKLNIMNIINRSYKGSNFLAIVNKYIKYFKQYNYSVTIFLDNRTLRLFPLLKRYTNKSVYFQLEITDKKYCNSLNDRSAKWLERYSAKRIDYIITQDLWRAAYCAGEFGVPVSKFLLLPNSPVDTYENSNYLKKRYNIPDNKLIVGYVGMIDPYTIPEWLCEQIKQIDNVQFVFHTHKSRHPYYLKIKSNLSDVVIFSDEFIPSNHLHELYGSIDIGLALYDFCGLENKYTTLIDLIGYSCGKINWYLACGKPAIYSPKRSLKFLENSMCGVPHTKDFNLADAIKIIKDNYLAYSFNCLEYFKNN